MNKNKVSIINDGEGNILILGISQEEYEATEKQFADKSEDEENVTTVETSDDET